MDTEQISQRRQVVYWRLLTSMFGFSEQGANFENMATEVVSELNLPQLILDPNISIENLLHRYPELEPDFNNPIIPEDETADATEATLRRALVISKLLLNAFGPNTQSGVVTAQQYAQWLKDVGFLEKALGCQPGSLRGQAPGSGTNAGNQNQGSGNGAGMGAGAGSGGGFTVTEEQLRATLKALEGELIQRMALQEVLKDDRLASQLTPSMALVEQLLREKANLSGNSLKNAKRLIQEYVNELAEVLRLQVAQAVAGKIDYSVPPKRVFRNLDLKRTIWKNLTNWNPEEQRLFVDRLYYHHTAKKKTPTRMIVVVDQSGSMVDAMVQCTILASIFAGLPNVDVHLLAFDTQVIDLTAWVHDPFEVLLRTNLGGGTYIYAALQEAAQKILEPQNTVMVLISDFYEGGSDQVLFDYIKSLKESGLHFIPVGAVTSSGYFSVNQWFRDKLKELGMPILTGSPKKLIEELKKVIVS
ncbi:VWA domain-containing protein [Nostoc sp. CENA67]|uniref:VWA domain-containing protein n=1 Tax=Amazonocrinis nigriterrae CENA67 TaxID=2794033 RepID=A0A8J7HU09_9NOST|nr:VWA domain-containing protein [Amazonocrinis nigriterrae]MBH8565522.1 VWA domain-containing protein [Amazonocrinis nigriterrae CENA67]